MPATTIDDPFLTVTALVYVNVALTPVPDAPVTASVDACVVAGITKLLASVI